MKKLCLFLVIFLNIFVAKAQQTLYLVGSQQGQGWNLDNPIELAPDKNTYTYVFTMGEKIEFKISTVKSNDWGTFNSGCLGLESNGAFWLSNDKEYELEKGKTENLHIEARGTYGIKIIYKNNSYNLTVVKLDDNESVSINGTFNNWNGTSKRSPDAYGKVTFDNLAIGNSEFKVVHNDNWCGRNDKTIEQGVWQVVDYGAGENMTITYARENQKFNVEYNCVLKQIKVLPVLPEQIYVRGDLTQWAPNETFVLKNKGINPGDETEYIFEGEFSEFSGNFILGEEGSGFLYGATGNDPFIDNGGFHDAWPGSTANFLLRAEKYKDVKMIFYYKMNNTSSSLYFEGDLQPITIPDKVQVRIYNADSDQGEEIERYDLTLESKEPNGNGEYIYKGVVPKLTGFFKIADETYSQFNYGYGVNGTENDKLVYSGHTNKARYITDGFKNFEVGEGGTIYNAHITFYYNPNDESDTSTTDDISSWLHIKGTPKQFNLRANNLSNWDEEAAIKLEPAFDIENPETAGEDYYVYYANPNGLTGDFKIAYNDWALDYGSASGGNFAENTTYEGKEGGSDFVAPTGGLSNGVLMFYYSPFGTSQVVFTTHSNKAYVVSDGEGPEFNHDSLNDMFMDYLPLELENPDKPTPRGEFVFKGAIPPYGAFKGGLRIVDGVEETKPEEAMRRSASRVAAITSATGAVDHGLADGDVSISEWPQGEHKLVKGGTGKLTLDESRLDNAEFTFTYQPNTTMVTTLEIGGGITTGIESVSVDGDADNAVYYNLQGVRVVNPEHGVFIRVSGNTAEKVVY